MNPYAAALWLYIIAAAVSFIPVAIPLLRKTKRETLNPGGPSFEESEYFSNSARTVLTQHYQRLRGTLEFWKNQVTKYRRFHNYSVVWVTISTVSVPFLAQAVSVSVWGRWLITIVGVHAALVLAFSRAFRVEANYRSFRHGESEFYDLYRRMLDRPKAFGSKESAQIDTYIEQVEVLRRYIRSAETDNLPSIEEVAQGPERENAGTSGTSAPTLPATRDDRPP
jgi:hypothetical protein